MVAIVQNRLPFDLINTTLKKCNRVIERTQEAKRARSSRSLESLLDSLGETVVDRTSNVSGDERKAFLRQNLKLLRTATKHQKQFMEVFTQCLLPFMYGEEFDENEFRLKEEHDIDDLMQFALLCCPRRFGKSRIVAWFTACALVSLPSLVSTLFSPGRRQSYYLMEQIRKDIAVLDKANPGMIRPKKGKDNKETYAIEVHGSERLVRGLPAKEQTVRGTDGNFIVCEEAAAMTKKFFTDVVAPISGPKTTAMVCISTISGSGDMKENWFTSLLNMRRPNGKSYFSTFKTILACEKCVELGIADTCEHRFSELPHWHSEEKQMLLRAIYEQLGERGKGAQELMGISQNDAQPALDRKHVHAMFSNTTNPPVEDREVDEKPSMLFVAVDPSAGGQGSDTAILSAFHNRQDFVICGMECLPSKMAIKGVYVEYLVRHVRELLALPLFSQAKVVFSIESNMGPVHTQEASDALLAEFPGRVLVLRKEGYTTSQLRLHNAPKTLSGEPNTLGKKTDGLVKVSMYKMYCKYLAARSIRFYKHMVTVYSAKPQDEKFDKTGHVVGILRQQSLDLLLTYKVPTEDQMAFQDIKYTISGKSKGPDDMITVAQLCLFWGNQFMENDLFRSTGQL